MTHSYRLGLVTWGYQVRIPGGTDICHRGCAYTVLQTVQRYGVYNDAYGTVHFKELLRSFEVRVGHSPGFGPLSVAILPWLCRRRRKAILIYYSVICWLAGVRLVGGSQCYIMIDMVGLQCYMLIDRCQAGWFTQFAVVCWRSMCEVLRNKRIIGARLIYMAVCDLTTKYTFNKINLQ